MQGSSSDLICNPIVPIEDPAKAILKKESLDSDSRASRAWNRDCINHVLGSIGSLIEMVLCRETPAVQDLKTCQLVQATLGFGTNGI